ncbi:MAG: DUF3624 family protein [Alphaproteobacteria bacterium]|nr:DUF3624 family protein [Alphaproteobacteria bacterium]
MKQPFVSRLVSKLGTCPWCMHKAFVAASLASICAVIGYVALGRSVISAAGAAIAVALTLLWTAHLFVYAVRVTKASLSSGASKEGINNARRAFIPTVAKAFLAVALATAVPMRPASAQGFRNCRVQCGGSIRCCPANAPYLSYCDCRCYRQSPNCASGYADCLYGAAC